MTDLLSLATSRLDEIVADAIALIEVESPSHDLDAVRRSADAVSALLHARLGVQPERIVIGGSTHLRVRWGTATRVLLLGHHDTVWPLGTLARIPASVEGGVLRGPGSVDMKGGLAIAIHALAMLRAEHGDASLDGVTVLITGDEEVGSPNSRELIEQTATGALATLVLEAGGDAGELKIERKGTSMYRVEAEGKAAHAGLEPEKGVNAGVVLAHAILEIAALNECEPGLSVVPTRAEIGTTTNTVPAAASVFVDARSHSAAAQHRLDVLIRALTSPVPGARLQVSGGINRLPLESAVSAGLYSEAELLASQLGLPALEGIAVGGASDGNFTAGIGVATLDGMGAWGGGAHAETEHARVEGFAPRAALVAALVRSLLSDSAPVTAEEIRYADIH